MIATAVQKGQMVYLYDERGMQFGSVPCGGDGSLQGYTASTVSIKKGQYVYVYDERGMQKSSIFVG